MELGSFRVQLSTSLLPQSTTQNDIIIPMQESAQKHLRPWHHYCQYIVSII
jgi:hypothetical protein